MTEIIRPDREKGSPGKSILLHDENNHQKGFSNPGATLIEPGGIVQLRSGGEG